eukprot:6514035-Ditylum_brightwellii.AAC.2
MISNIHGTLCNKNGAKLHTCTMKNVKYCKENKYNLFSITKRQKDGWRLHGNKNQILITKGQHKVVFDIQIPTKEGLIFAAYIDRNGRTEVANTGTETLDKLIRCNINKGDLLGHSDEGHTRAVAKNLGWEII